MINGKNGSNWPLIYSQQEMFYKHPTNYCFTVYRLSKPNTMAGNMLSQDKQKFTFKYLKA